MASNAVMNVHLPESVEVVKEINTFSIPFIQAIHLRLRLKEKTKVLPRKEFSFLLYNGFQSSVTKH